MKKMIDLIRIEMSRIFKSKVYWLFVIIIIMYSIFQFSIIFTMNEEAISCPKEEDYEGYNLEELKLEIMSDKIGNLGYDFAEGTYNAAPFGINKQVRLSDNDMGEIELILEFLIGQEKQEFENWFKDYNNCREIVIIGEGDYKRTIMKSIPPAISQLLSWEQFLGRMEAVSAIIGRGSYYDRDMIEKNLVYEKNYEEELRDYNALLNEDKILGAVARLISDYLGIILSFLPVMLGVMIVHEDKKNNICDIIYSKKISSFKITYSRYFAALISIMIVVLIIMFLPTTVIGIRFVISGYQVDFLAFAKYSFGWLMPTAMMSLAMGFLISELINGMVAIIIQFLWFYSFDVLYTGTIIGHAGLEIAPRFNAFGEYHRFALFFNELLLNRVFYLIASIGIVFITAILYEIKRKGKFGVKNAIYHNEE